MKDGNRRKRQVWDKERILSTLIAVAVVATLVFGVFSVVKTVNRVGESGNVVNLNETKENVAIKIEEASEADLSEKVALGTDSKMYESDSANEVSNGSNNGKFGNEQGTSNVADNANNNDQGASNVTDNAKGNQDTGTKGAQDGDNRETKGSGTDVSSKGKVGEVAKPEQVAASVANYSFDEASSVIWPVTGDVTLGFSMDNTTFFKTLGMYKCSQGIIISAARGTKVAVAASGVVKDIVVSDETKTTITVAIGDGYETTYGLLDNITVKQGDVVTKGQLLGNVSEPSAYYKEEGPGVYFAMTRNGEPVDPEVYLEQ